MRIERSDTNRGGCWRYEGAAGYLSVDEPQPPIRPCYEVWIRRQCDMNLLFYDTKA